MNNSEIFLNCYNKLTNYLKRNIKKDIHMTLNDLINKNEKKIPAIRIFKKELRKYGELRNVIIHEDKITAEPTNYAVERIKKIFNEITKPIKIYSLIKHEISKLSTNEKLSSALMLMKDNNFSQIPIYRDNEFVKMLNLEMITDWLAENINEDIISISETSIENILSCCSNKKETIFMSRNSNIYEIFDCYTKGLETKTKLQAIIITQNGQKKEKPLTIITEYDLPKIAKVIGYRQDEF